MSCLKRFRSTAVFDASAADKKLLKSVLHICYKVQKACLKNPEFRVLKFRVDKKIDLFSLEASVKMMLNGQINNNVTVLRSEKHGLYVVIRKEIGLPVYVGEQCVPV